MIEPPKIIKLLDECKSWILFQQSSYGTGSAGRDKLVSAIQEFTDAPRIFDSQDNFVAALARVLNHYSQENASNSPDWMLAQYLENCLSSLNQLIQQRENYYRRDPRPTPLKESR